MEQLPPIERLTSRSAATASHVGRWASGARACIKSPRPVQISMPKAPCPAAGSMLALAKVWAMRCPRPKRFKPAAANTIAAYCPSSSLRKRVSRLPRSGAIFKSGRKAFKSATRRRLDVPTTAPCGKSCRLWVWLGRDVAAPICCGCCGNTNASCGSSRSITQANSKPAGSSIGTSFRLCTARSARPSASAVSSSLTNSPLPPTLESDRSKIWSPCVVIGNKSTVCPSACSCALTCSACQSAKRLSRVAITIFICRGFLVLS